MINTEPVPAAGLVWFGLVQSGLVCIHHCVISGYKWYNYWYKWYIVLWPDYVAVWHWSTYSDTVYTAPGTATAWLTLAVLPVWSCVAHLQFTELGPVGWKMFTRLGCLEHLARIWFGEMGSHSFIIGMHINAKICSLIVIITILINILLLCMLYICNIITELRWSLRTSPLIPLYCWKHYAWIITHVNHIIHGSPMSVM